MIGKAPTPVRISRGGRHLVAGTAGGASDGSWSRDYLGNEKGYAGASAAYPAITQHVTNHGYP